MAVTATPYPWGALDTVAREAATRLASARRRLAAAVDTGALGASLSEVLEAPTAVAVGGVRVVSELPRPSGVALAFTAGPGALRVSLDVGRDLAARLVARLLGGAARLARPGVATPPALEGALAAVAAVVARRSHGASAALVPLGAGSWQLAHGERALELDAWVTVGGERHAVRAHVAADLAAAGPELGSREALERLGELPLALPLVGAVSVGSRAEVESLAQGDVWLPGAGWTLARRDGALAGELRAVAPLAEAAIALRLCDARAAVVVATTRVAHDTEAFLETSDEHDVTTIADAVAEAPVVVRVEVASVTLAARAWAALQPGDVVSLGRPLGDPVVLRVAGREIARGDLVDVDGELGVRIVRRGAA